MTSILTIALTLTHPQPYVGTFVGFLLEHIKFGSCGQGNLTCIDASRGNVAALASLGRGWLVPSVRWF